MKYFRIQSLGIENIHENSNSFLWFSQHLKNHASFLIKKIIEIVFWKKFCTHLLYMGSILDFKRCFKEIDGILLTLINAYTLGRRLHIRNKHAGFFLKQELKIHSI